MARFKLFYVPKTRATRPLWLLEELGERGAPIDWEPVRLHVKEGDNKKPAYLAVHPLGHVPALLDGETPVIESAAICLYLADQFIERKLAPAFSSPLRALYYQWAIFSGSTLEPPIGDVMKHEKLLPEGERVPAIAAKGRERFREVAAVIEAALAKAPYLVGGEFSVVDLLIAANLNWARMLGLLEGHPALEAWCAAQIGRPAAKRAFALP